MIYNIIDKIYKVKSLIVKKNRPNKIKICKMTIIMKINIIYKIIRKWINNKIITNKIWCNIKMPINMIITNCHIKMKKLKINILIRDSHSKMKIIY